MADIEKELVWVTLKYKDNSYRYILTTLNKELLKDVELKEGYLYDFRYKTQVSLSDIEDAQVSDNLYSMGDEVSQYLYDLL